MESLVQPDILRNRILLWAEEETRLGKLPAKAGTLLEAVLYRGEIARSEMVKILGLSDRHARRIVAKLIERKIFISAHQRKPLQLTFPAELASRWMPGLFPDVY